jgi:hypothetical protein
MDYDKMTLGELTAELVDAVNMSDQERITAIAAAIDRGWPRQGAPHYEQDADGTIKPARAPTLTIPDDERLVDAIADDLRCRYVAPQNYEGTPVTDEREEWRRLARTVVSKLRALSASVRR